MRSIFVRLLLWFTATLIVCTVGAGVTTSIVWRFAPGGRDFISRAISFQAEEASYAFQTGGAAGLNQFLERLRKSLPGDYYLLDENGKDVETGKFHPDLQVREPNYGRRFWWPLLPPPTGRVTIAWPSRDRKFRLVVRTSSPRSAWEAFPSYLWTTIALTVCCYLLAVNFASPLRSLKQTVEQFGRGDLAARADTRRRDEFGGVAKAFNVMAARIETLLTAERRLLQDVSHELRSPLARLEFAIALARTSRDRDSALNRIQKEADRLSTLVAELLQVTRAEGDPDSRNLGPVSLPMLLGDLIEDSSVEAGARGCELRFTCPEAIVVTGDRELIRRAVENVIRNAIRYAPENTPVEIRVQKQTDKALISVRDYGPGVPEDSLLSLFKPFYRVEADRNRNHGGGLGLGLAIAQRAVSLHHGKILANNAGPGLLVEIELPLASTKETQPSWFATA